MPFVQTSAAREPNDESVLSELAHTAVGNVEARDEDAVRMALLVLVFTAVVPAAIAAAIEDDAVPTIELVFEFTSVVTAATPVARELEAARTVALVFELTAAVPTVMAEAIEVDAEFVLAFTAAVTAAVCVSVFELTDAVPDVIAAPSDVDAVVMLAAVARVPESRVLSESLRVAYDQTSLAERFAEVSVLVPLVQTSAAREPNVVSVLSELAQTAVGNVEARDEEAVTTSESVANDPEVREAPVSVRVAPPHTSLTRDPNELNVLEVLFHTELARVLVETSVAPTTKDLSIFTRSPPGADPQAIWAGQVPSGPDEGMV